MSSTASRDSRRKATATRRRERERQILQATRQLFDERGVRDVSIDDIARLVGTNRAILYRHFSGKEELFALTLVGYLDELKGELDDAVASADSPDDQLAAMVVAFVDYGLANPAFVDCAQMLMRRPGPELLDEISEAAMFRLGRAISTCLGTVSAALDRGVADGEFTVDDTTLLANHMYATGLGALQLARVGMLVKQVAPGIPGISPISPDQVKSYLIASSRALARN